MSESPRTLTARSVVYSYGPTPALRGANLEIEPGEIVTISGPSGCGKSTLLLNLAGVLTPDLGQVTFGDLDIGAASDGERSRLRRTVFGVLFQFGQLVPELTAGENVALPLLLEGHRRDAARAAALVWLERFGVADFVDEKPARMSGGQMQRVAVARSMVTEPQVLFADEPTGALDALAGDRVMTEIVRVARQAGTTVVLVTHDPKVAAYGDREVRMTDGVLSVPVGRP